MQYEVWASLTICSLKSFSILLGCDCISWQWLLSVCLFSNKPNGLCVSFLPFVFYTFRNNLYFSHVSIFILLPILKPFHWGEYLQPLSWILSFSSVSSTARRCLEQTIHILRGCFLSRNGFMVLHSFSCTTEHLISFDCHENMITGILHTPVTVLPKFTWSWWTINHLMICYIIYICLLQRKI